MRWLPEGSDENGHHKRASWYFATATVVGEETAEGTRKVVVAYDDGGGDDEIEWPDADAISLPKDQTNLARAAAVSEDQKKIKGQAFKLQGDSRDYRVNDVFYSVEEGIDGSWSNTTTREYIRSLRQIRTRMPSSGRRSTTSSSGPLSSLMLLSSVEVLDGRDRRGRRSRVGPIVRRGRSGGSFTGHVAAFGRKRSRVEKIGFLQAESRRKRLYLTAKRKMILTNCAACAAPLAHNAPRCVRCNTRYCNSTCQHDHWRRGHKQICKRYTAAATQNNTTPTKNTRRPSRKGVRGRHEGPDVLHLHAGPPLENEGGPRAHVCVPRDGGFAHVSCSGGAGEDFGRRGMDFKAEG